MEQRAEYTHECLADQIAAKSTVCQRQHRRQLEAQAAEVTLSNPRRRAMKLASERELAYLPTNLGIWVLPA